MGLIKGCEIKERKRGHNYYIESSLLEQYQRTMCLCCPLFINCVLHLYYCPIHLCCNYQLLIWCAVCSTAHEWEAAEIIQISHNLVFSIFFDEQLAVY